MHDDMSSLILFSIFHNWIFIAHDCCWRNWPLLLGQCVEICLLRLGLLVHTLYSCRYAPSPCSVLRLLTLLRKARKTKQRDQGLGEGKGGRLSNQLQNWKDYVPVEVRFAKRGSVGRAGVPRPGHHRRLLRLQFGE